MKEFRGLCHGAWVLSGLMAVGLLVTAVSAQVTQTSLPGKSIPKFVDPLPDLEAGFLPPSEVTLRAGDWDLDRPVVFWYLRGIN